jgi:hypothetical protein
MMREGMHAIPAHGYNQKQEKKQIVLLSLWQERKDMF